MNIQTIGIERVSVVSSKPFERVVGAIEAAVGRPHIGELSKKMAEARNPAELDAVVQPVLGPTGLMLFAQFDLGAVVRKEQGCESARVVRFVIGNPLIMKEMVKHVPDAGSYAPVTILVDQRADGVHLTYDRVAGFLAPYGDSSALAVARDLDRKIEQLLQESAN
ncbi:MAG TPA: DUF302 domain-containing protein [Bryobacteraceae bacterium]|nr:DUF302 domain-containing protein [Bryobacteraceae bacterium]